MVSRGTMRNIGEGSDAHPLLNNEVKILETPCSKVPKCDSGHFEHTSPDRPSGQCCKCTWRDPHGHRNERINEGMDNFGETLVRDVESYSWTSQWLGFLAWIIRFWLSCDIAWKGFREREEDLVQRTSIKPGLFFGSENWQQIQVLWTLFNIVASTGPITMFSVF